ncbi:MAG: thioesterase family protein [Bacteroidota bacterium]|nr:thioesterase family protein [Bacteroidota bacterium]
MQDSSMLITTDFLIKLYDVDGMGFVSNITYVRWLEDLRSLFLEKYYPLSTLIASGISPVIANTNIDYLKPLTIRDRAQGYAWITEMGSTRWTMDFEIRQGDTVHCRARQRGYFIDLESGRPARVPREIADAYADETSHLLRSPKNAQRLLESIKEREEGGGPSRS